MTIEGDVAARALTAAWEHLVASASDGWTARARGALAAVTMVPVPILNGVFVDEVNADPDVVAGLLDRVAATGRPHFLQLRPGSDPSLAELAARRGMTPDADIPLMVLDDSSVLIGAQPEALVIRVLVPEQAGRHASLAAAGFEAPEELFRQLVTPAVLNAPGVRCYVGEADGVPVTTGFGVTLGNCVGVFNIATPPAYRRRGYGAAVTAHAVRDGTSQGGRWAWLQSSPAGYAVYEQLGFRTAESWHCWLMTT